MKKRKLSSTHRRCTMLTAAMLISAASYGQGIVKGSVKDASGEPVIGATVRIEGQSGGTVTDFDGNFTINVSKGAQLQISYVGYLTQTITATSDMNVVLQEDAAMLNDVVVIGYGTQKKTDLTGSISTVGAKDFNTGVIASAEQLVNGKISGVQITNSGGSSSAGATIRIRGGASLNASNSPLIVVDGVPMENIDNGISGAGNPLSLINPQDIETMTVLKDASSTAIYGSRASNGVIIITTKKGSKSQGRPKFTFTMTNNMQTIDKNVDMMSYEQMKDVVSRYGSEKQKGLAGILTSDAAKEWHDQVYASASGLGNLTDWNDQIYQRSFGTDNNLSISGMIGTALPYRVSVGYMHQAGILHTDWNQRATASLNLSPSFFEDHLKLNISAKGTTSSTRFPNSTAIFNAMTMNPYATVNSNDGSFSGYYEAADAQGAPITGATKNPTGLLETYRSRSAVKRFIGNVDVDYKLHFFPDLKLHVTGGYDYSHGKGTIWQDPYAASGMSGTTPTGSDYAYGPQKNINRLLTVYANYHKDLEGSLPQTIDVTAGYDNQLWKRLSPEYNYYTAFQTVNGVESRVDQRHALMSYYGRMNYTLLDRYMLTATVRRDGSSRFADGKKWGTFPSVALAYNVAREGFFESMSNVMNDLKLRVSYGITGQQDGIGNYNYMSAYTISQMGALYQFGDRYYETYRPSSYNADLTWETTKAFNVGLDLGFLNNRFTASVDFYTRKTEDLLATVPVAAGTNFAKEMLRNVGNVSSKGVELSFNANIISTNDWQWILSGNATWQRVRITNLKANANAAEVNTPQGYLEGGHFCQIFTEGYAPYAFYVYKQVYDEETGRPVEGLYADLNGDGKIDDNDRYRYHSPAPDWIFGLSTSLTYKRLTLSAALRANVGNYVYNKTAMNTGAWETVFYNDYQMNRMNASYLETGFMKRQYESDHYVENASFLKMDNISLSYNFGKISRYVSLNTAFRVQNVFTITKYSGIDPEVNGGIDSNIYPRPRTYSLSIGVEF